mgnify:FL=1
MSREGVLPSAFGRVHSTWRTPWLAILCTTVVALGLASWSGVRTLGGTTALLVLCVFALVNVAVLVLRRQRVAHGHYVAPTICPVLGFLSCAYLASPWAGRDPAQYEIAGVLLLVGLALFVLNGWLHGRHLRRTQVQ